MNYKLSQNIVTILRGNKIPTSFNGRKIFFSEDGSNRNLDRIKVGDPINVYNYAKLFELIFNNNHQNDFKITNEDLENIVIKSTVANKTYTIKEVGVLERILIGEPHIDVIFDNEKYNIISSNIICIDQRFDYNLNFDILYYLNVLNRNSERITTKQYLQKLNNLKKVAEFFLSNKTDLLEKINNSIKEVNEVE